MPQLLIRNLDEQTIQNLKELARQHNRSLQEEVKLILEEHANRLDESPLGIADRWQSNFAGLSFSDSAEMVREDRGR